MKQALLYSLLVGLFVQALAHANVCTWDADKPLLPVTTNDLLMHLFVDFHQTDDQSRELKFSTEDIQLIDGKIIFTNPRLNGRVISFERSDCTESKRNLFGMDVCQKIEPTPVAATLCQQLGLSPDSQQEGSSKVVRSSQEPLTYKYSDGQWYSLRLYSVLAPTIRFQKLQSFSCQYL